MDNDEFLEASVDAEGTITSEPTVTDVSRTAKVLPAFVEVKWARPGREEQRYRLPVIITRGSRRGRDRAR